MKEGKEVKEITGISAFPIHEENPYMSGLSVETRGKTVAIGNKTTDVLNTETGEIENCAFIGIKEKVDAEQFVKIYRAQIKTLFNLTQTGIKVFGYFMDSLRISDDRVLFDMKKCQQFTGYKSGKSIFNGIADLLKSGFIARTDNHNFYYINPAIFFNGDRMVIVKEYEKVNELDKKQVFYSAARERKAQELNAKAALENRERQTQNEQ